jgi:hypothetical protein
MKAKLTLNLKKEIIEKAKTYASKKNISLSKLIEDYLRELTSNQKNNSITISEFVKSLSIKGEIPLDFNYKNEISNYLEQKHK